jgi:predicted alpha/beta hydrolase family esterase
MKRAIIVHCWGGVPNYCWYPQAARTLEAAGFIVETPEMPNTDHPVYAEWMKTLQRVIGTPDDELFLIGHSLGCITILQYLQSLPANQHIGGAVLVAGFSQSLGKKYAETDSFFVTPIDPETVKAHVGRIVAIHSDNDPHVPLAHGDIFERYFDAELIVKKNMKHFSGALDEETSCTSLPEVTAAIMRMSHQL